MIRHHLHRRLLRAPAWLGPVLAIGAFVALRHLAPLALPHLDGSVPIGEMLARILPPLAWVVGAAVLLIWLAAEVSKARQRRLLDAQQNLDSIRALTWRQFEQLVAEAYRRRGHAAEVVDQPAGDGGVDVVLHDDHGRRLIQCKHWKAKRVGVAAVRELLGVVTSEGAAGGIVVTSGRFTPDAEAFARNNAIELVGGPALAELVAEVQQGDRQLGDTSEAADGDVAAPRCPTCGSEMVHRTARRGDHAGSAFWGCATFPNCRGTREMTDGAPVSA